MELRVQKQSLHLQSIFNKSDKTLKRGNEQCFKQMMLGQLSSHIKRNKVLSLSHTMQKLFQNGLKPKYEQKW